VCGSEQLTRTGREQERASAFVAALTSTLSRTPPPPPPPARSTNPDWGHDLWVLTVTAAATYALGFALLVLLYPSRQR
jgi:hypothetical protein